MGRSIRIASHFYNALKHWGADGRRKRAAVVYVAGDTTAINEFWAELAYLLGVSRIIRLRMRPIAKVGVMQSPSQHERQTVSRCDVPRCLLEAMHWLIGVLVWQGGQAAEPAIGRQWIR